MKELLRTTDPTVIPYARFLLESEDIEAFEVDVHIGAMAVLPRRLMVRERDHFRASALMRDAGIPVES